MGFDSVWKNSRLRSRLEFYYQLVRERNIPLYQRCKTIPIEIDMHHNETPTLWKVHTRIKQDFEQSLHEHPYIEPDKWVATSVTPSFLDLKIELAQRMLKQCAFCENDCGVDRTVESSKKGRCGVLEKTYISSTFLHMGEELPLIPSGTIFFAGCSFDCVFCQNEDISTAGKKFPLDHAGQLADAKTLANLAQNLVHKGAINLNYVGGDPTPNLHTILESMRYQTHNRCQLWNSNFYNTIPALELLSDVMDLWLPDFKYGNNTCAKRYSGISKYRDVIVRNFEYIHQHGTKNIIIRHLVLPGHVECCTKPILDWIAAHLPEAVVNIMPQYHPEYLVSSVKFSEINRRPTTEEMDQAYAYARSLDLEFESVH